MRKIIFSLEGEYPVWCSGQVSCHHLKWACARQPCAMKVLVKLHPALYKSQQKQALWRELKGAKWAGIHPKAVGTERVTECSLDSWTAYNSRSYVFHVLSRWSDIKLVKGLNLSKVRPVITVCSQLAARAGAFSAAGQTLPWPACSLCKAQLVQLLPIGAAGEEQLLTTVLIAELFLSLPGKGGFALWCLDEGNV